MKMNGMCYTPGTLAKQHSRLETIKTSRTERVGVTAQQSRPADTTDTP